MKIDKFEDIKAWQEAPNLVNEVYLVCSVKAFKNDYRLVDQIRGAAVSIMANIAEGFDSQSNQEFIKFLIYARRSCSEVQSHLYVALDQDYIPADKFQELYNQTKKTAQLINGFIKYLRNPNRNPNDDKIG